MMTELEDQIKQFHLHIKTHKSEINCEEKWNRLVVEEKFWNQVLGLSLNKNQLKEFFNTINDEKREEYFNFGISCFMCFVRCNFTGPSLPSDIEKFLKDERFIAIDFASRLSVNNEDINVNTVYPALLATAQVIFENCTINNIINLWWCCRALMIHQEILDELSPTLLSNADRLGRLIQSVSLTGYTKAEMDIELAQMYLKFRNISKTRDHLNSACDLLGVQHELIGKLGKRTKHQTKDIAQLSLQVNLSIKEGINRPDIEEIVLPQNFKLDDDVRLDQVLFSETPAIYTKLPNTEQKLLLSIIQQKLISSPPDELNVEEILPYLELILNQRNTYSVRVMALLLRCKLESKNKRTIERCLKQYEDIINYFNRDEPSAFHRVGDVFGTSFLPIWKVQAQHADVLLNFGLVKNSLDIYLNIKLWEEVIICYTILQMREKAAQIIREQLELHPTVKLLCLLGDATDDVACYEKAWEMSKRRSHRAQRHWGRFLFNRKKYEECIPHFEKSLSINPLQSRIWLDLGFAALETEKWQTAATAYRRFTNLEPDGFEGWNNLAQAYIKMGNKRSAHQAVLEALKCNYENWKIWENLLVISCDILNFSDVIRAYNRLLEMKGKYLHLETLHVLVANVCNDGNDCDGKSCRELYLQNTRELIGKVTAAYPTNGEIWELHALLAPDLLLRAMRYQRAYKGFAQLGWEKNPKTCCHVLNICNKLADIALDDQMDPANAILGSIKLNVSSAITAIKKQNWEETKELLEEVTNQLSLIVQKIKRASAAFKIDVN